MRRLTDWMLRPIEDDEEGEAIVLAVLLPALAYSVGALVLFLTVKSAPAGWGF